HTLVLPLSLHDALPICGPSCTTPWARVRAPSSRSIPSPCGWRFPHRSTRAAHWTPPWCGCSPCPIRPPLRCGRGEHPHHGGVQRSEEHTSELQSRENLV